jgi:hypothetical protein
LPLLFAAALDGVDVRRAWTRGVLTALGAVPLVAFGASLVGSVTSHLALADGLRRDDVATEQLLGLLAEQRSVPRALLRTLWTYGTSSPCYALWYGDDSADRILQADVERLCPRDMNLNVWNATVETAAGNVPLTEYSDWDVLILPETEARWRPQLQSVGQAQVTGIASLEDSQLLVISRSR